MKYLDLLDLTKELSKKTGCSIDAAYKFVEVQDLYYDKTGVNVYPDPGNVPSVDPVSINETEMKQYIVDNAGMAMSFVERLLDAEMEYMKEHELVTPKGGFVPFLKGRGEQKNDSNK
jgi:hypothetical protein